MNKVCFVERQVGFSGQQKKKSYIYYVTKLQTIKKHFKILTAAAMVCLLAGVLIYTGCKKAELEQTNSDYAQLIAAQDYSNNELVHFIKHADPPLSDQDLLGALIAASPLDDNIIKEVLKRGNPPANAPLSDETLQMILLFNLPLSDHILQELEKAFIGIDLAGCKTGPFCQNNECFVIDHGGWFLYADVCGTPAFY